MFVESTKADGHTKQILAYNAKAGLKVVDKPGVQEVPDHPAVQRLIQEGVIKKVSVRASSAKPDPEPEKEPEKKPTATDDKK